MYIIKCSLWLLGRGWMMTPGAVVIVLVRGNDNWDRDGSDGEREKRAH